MHEDCSTGEACQEAEETLNNIIYTHNGIDELGALAEGTRERDTKGTC